MKNIKEANLLRDAVDTIIKTIVSSGLDGNEQKCIDLLETAIICNECLEFNHIHNLIMILYLYDIKDERLNKIIFEANRCLIKEVLAEINKDIKDKVMTSVYTKDFFD